LAVPVTLGTVAYGAKMEELSTTVMIVVAARLSHGNCERQDESRNYPSVDEFP